MDERPCLSPTGVVLKRIILALGLGFAVALCLRISFAASLTQVPFGLTPTGEPPTPTATATTPPVTPVPVALKVTLQRPNAPPPDPAWAVPVQVALYSPGNADMVVHQWDLTLDLNGRWNGTLDLAPGAYDVRIRNLHTLRNVKRNVAISGPLALNMGVLLEGDANGDNTVNILDFARLRNSFFLDRGSRGSIRRWISMKIRPSISWTLASCAGASFKEEDIEVTALAQRAGLSAALPVTLTLAPSERDLAVGEMVSFTVTVDARQQPLLGLDVEIFFRPDIVAVVDASGAPVSVVTPGTTFSYVLGNRVDAVNGRILYSTANLDQAAGGQLQVATFYLRGLRPGAAGVRFGPRSLGVNDSGVVVPLTLAPPAISVGGVKVYQTYLPLSLRNR